MSNGNAGLLGIAVVERETGIPKETLRVWERRYGAPPTTRSPSGGRLYRAVDVELLRLVKQLIDRGFRPGELLGKTLSELHSLVDAMAPAGPAPGRVPAETSTALTLFSEEAPEQFRLWLQRILLDRGLRAFVLDLVRPLCRQAGSAWECGALSVISEHIITEQIQSVLRGAVAQLPVPAPGARKILLTTLPTEAHGLGILMLQALLAMEGHNCLSLGVETPIADIATFCGSRRCDVIALSFSAHYAARRAKAELNALRAAVAPETAIWAGGSGILPLLANKRNLAPGIQLMTELEAAVSAAVGQGCDSD